MNLYVSVGTPIVLDGVNTPPSSATQVALDVTYEAVPVAASPSLGNRSVQVVIPVSGITAPNAVRNAVQTAIAADAATLGHVVTGFMWANYSVTIP